MIKIRKGKGVTLMSTMQYLLIFCGCPLLGALIGVFIGALYNNLMQADSSLFFWGFYSLFISMIFIPISCYILNNKGVGKLIINQKKLPKKIRLSVSKSRQITTFVILGLAIYIFRIFYKQYTYVPSFLELVILFGILVFTFLHDKQKGSVLPVLELLKSRFENVEYTKTEYVGDFLNELMQKSTPIRAARELSGKNELMLKFIYGDANYINFINNSYRRTIGVLNAKTDRYNRINPSYRPFDFRIQSFAFIELEHGVNLTEEISIFKNQYWKSMIQDEKNIIPLYENMGVIVPEKSREYAEKILTEKVQEYIAELRAHFDNFAIYFYDNKILISIKNGRWSSWFSRTFMKEKCAENIFKTTEVVLNYLERIANEIEKNEDY